MPAMRSSLAISTSWRTAAITSAEVLVRCPRPANPMDEQNDLGCIGIDIGNHVMDHGADDALLQPCIGRGGGPNALEIGCERGERCRIDGGRDRGGVMGGNLGFDLRHAGERLV